MASQCLAFVLLAETIVTLNVLLARHQRVQRVQAQTVVIIEIFVAQRQRTNALAQQLRQRVFDEDRIAQILKATHQPLDKSQLQIDTAQEQRTSVAAEITARKIRGDFAGCVGLKFESLLLTLCHSEVGLVVSLNTFNHSGLPRPLRYLSVAV
jgi:hypothetical protein